MRNRRYLFIAGRKRSGLAPPRIPIRPQRGAGLGTRLARAFSELLARHMRVVIMGTDSPLLSPRQIQAAFDELGFCEAVLGPCPDGGFYLIGLRRLPSGLFRGVRWSTRFACRDMLRNLLARGASCSLLSAVPDVDRPRDVKNLAGTLARSPGGRRLAPATWQFLKDWTAGGKARSKKRSRR